MSVDANPPYIRYGQGADYSDIREEARFERSEAIIYWAEFDPKVAAEEGLVCYEGSPIQGPINELGEECPWPWEPQQLTEAPLGQYHCPYCGGMVVAGIAHFDQTGEHIWETDPA